MSAADLGAAFIWVSGILIGAGCMTMLLGGVVYMIMEIADDE